MGRGKADMERLIAQRDQMLREMEALKNKMAGLEMAITLINSENIVPVNCNSFNRPSVKGVLFDLLKEVGTSGLNAATAVELADRRGITLHSGSVSSTLSRFKKEGAVEFDGERYRLPENRPAAQQPLIQPPWLKAVHQ